MGTERGVAGARKMGRGVCPRGLAVQVLSRQEGCQDPTQPRVRARDRGKGVGRLCCCRWPWWELAAHSRAGRGRCRAGLAAPPCWQKLRFKMG